MTQYHALIIDQHGNKQLVPCAPSQRGRTIDLRPDPASADMRVGFCTWTPQDGAPVLAACPECGHSQLAHIGTDHCPVCELVYQATPQFRRQQERVHRMDELRRGRSVWPWLR